MCIYLFFWIMKSRFRFSRRLPYLEDNPNCMQNGCVDRNTSIMRWFQSEMHSVSLTLLLAKPGLADGSKADRLTVRIQQPRDPELLLCNAESLLQVLLVASGPGFGQIDHVRPQGVQDRQEDHSTPPAGLKVFHIQCTTSSENTKKTWSYNFTLFLRICC